MPRVRTIFAAAAAALVGAAHAETIQITAKSDHTFDPDTVQAKEGDVLQFHFQPRNHSVVSGNYDYPCSPLQLGTGFYSAFVPTENDEAVRFLANPSIPPIPRPWPLFYLSIQSIHPSIQRPEGPLFPAIFVSFLSFLILFSLFSLAWMPAPFVSLSSDRFCCQG